MDVRVIAARVRKYRKRRSLEKVHFRNSGEGWVWAIGLSNVPSSYALHTHGSLYLPASCEGWKKKISQLNTIAICCKGHVYIASCFMIFWHFGRVQDFMRAGTTRNATAERPLGWLTTRHISSQIVDDRDIPRCREHGVIGWWAHLARDLSKRLS